MIAGREDVREQGEVAYFGHRLLLIGKFEQVEIGVRNHDVIGLAADPAAHIDITVGAAGPSRIHIQANAGLAFLAVAAAAAGDVEGRGNQVTNLQKLNIVAFFDDFAGDLVAQDHAGRRSGPAAHHVLVAAADIGRDQLQNDRVG